jgi:hypothetical protein
MGGGGLGAKMTGNIVAELSFDMHSHNEGCKEALLVFLSAP